MTRTFERRETPGGGKGTIRHLVNDAGAAARSGAVRQTLVRYPPTERTKP